MRTLVIFLPVLVLASGCTGEQAGGDMEPADSPFVAEVHPFGTTSGGEPVELITLRSPSGLEIDVSTYGAIVTRLLAPDRSGHLADIVLGHDSLADYAENRPYFGAIVGRYANRIASGRFTLDGVEYELAVNNTPNHLHGGDNGFDKLVWRAEPYSTGEEGGVVLTLVSPAGDEGYPGELTVRMTYAVTALDELRIDYEASTDAPTIVNLTHHSYWNLAGHDSGTILDHELQIAASRFTPVDETLIPTGELRTVEGTPFDFREPARVGARIDQDDEQVRRGGGYDHNFVLDGWSGDGTLRPAAVLRDPASGRVMEVLTTEPGLQLYSGNFLDGSDIGKGGTAYQHRTGLCLETQHFPDSPNQPGFPSTVLRPAETYRSTTVYRFSAE